MRKIAKEHGLKCFNPFVAGQGLSTKNTSTTLRQRPGLNPFGTGRGLSTMSTLIATTMGICFNPFEAGRGLLVHDHSFPLLLLMPQW